MERRVLWKLTTKKRLSRKVFLGLSKREKNCLVSVTILFHYFYTFIPHNWALVSLTLWRCYKKCWGYSTSNFFPLRESEESRWVGRLSVGGGNSQRRLSWLAIVKSGVKSFWWIVVEESGRKIQEEGDQSSEKIRDTLGVSPKREKKRGRLK